MATKKPRATITFDPHVYETITRLAAMQGRSLASVLGELLEGINPALIRTVALLEAARDAPLQVRQGLKQTVEDLDREMQQAVGGGLNQMDWLRGQMEGQEQAPDGGGKGGTRSTPADASNPRVVTRGSGSSAQRGVKARKPASGKASQGGKASPRQGGQDKARKALHLLERAKEHRELGDPLALELEAEARELLKGMR